MYITRLNLDPRNPVIQQWLRNRYRIHQRLWQGIPEEIQRKHESLKGATPPFLYRLEISPRLRMLVQSPYSIDWSRVLEGDKLRSSIRCGPEDTRLLEPERFITAGMAYRFNLLANPTRKKIFADSPSALKGKAHQQRWKKAKKIGVYSEADQLAWLAQRGARGGFQVESAIVTGAETISAAKGGTHAQAASKSGKIFTVTFSGVLRISDAEAFMQTYNAGIGSAKAFGCGMLLLARPQA